MSPASVTDSSMSTPYESPIATPFDSPLQRPVDTKPLPRPEDVHLILSDVDGTLFDDNHNIHPT
jgi:hypothetical protein